MASDLRGFARGFFAVVAPTCGILFAIAAFLPAISIEVIAHFTIGVAMLWTFLFFPYLAVIPELFSTSEGFVFAFLQWAVVGTVVGLFTPRQRPSPKLGMDYTRLIVSGIYYPQDTRTSRRKCDKWRRRSTACWTAIEGRMAW